MLKLIESIKYDANLFFCPFLLIPYALGQAASGAVQCQMMDMTYPGVVPMHKLAT